MKKKISIAGGTGFIGQELIKYFTPENDVIVLTRGIKNVQTNSCKKSIHFADDYLNLRFVIWDAKHQGNWSKEIEGADIIINLCGKSVNCRYTKKNKKEIFDSRTQPTAAIGEAIQKCVSPPKLWLNASSTTIYRNAADRSQDENNGEIENDFSVQVCKLWEQTFFEIRTPFTRKVALRMAVTLGSGGVMLPYFNLLKWGLGGHQGSGKQMYSWIHIKDTCQIINWIYEHKEMEGVYNCCSPKPVDNFSFMKILRKLTGHQFGLPAPKWMLTIGAKIIGTETELLLKSRWVIPTKLLNTGFHFQYEYITEAFKEIVNNSPRKNYHLI